MHDRIIAGAGRSPDERNYIPVQDISNHQKIVFGSPRTYFFLDPEIISMYGLDTRTPFLYDTIKTSRTSFQKDDQVSNGWRNGVFMENTFSFPLSSVSASSDNRMKKLLSARVFPQGNLPRIAFR